SAGARRGPLRVAPALGPARRGARAVAERAALGRGRSAAGPRRAADRAAGGGPRPRGPPHLRALVRAAPPAIAAPLPRGGSGPVCPPAIAGSGFHDRRRRPTPGLRPDQDAAAARPFLPRAHRRRNAAHARAPRGPRAHRPGIRSAAPGARLGVMSGTPPHPPSPASRSSTVLKKPFDLRQITEWAKELLDASDRRTGNG